MTRVEVNMFFLKDPPNPEEFQTLSQRYGTLDPLSMLTLVKFLRISSDMLAGIENLMAKYGLSQGRFLILVVLNRTPDRPATPSELAGKIGVTKATMTGLIRGLDRDGLISRKTDPADKRQFKIRLTPQGLTRLEEILPDYYQRAARAMSGLDQADKCAFIELLEKVHPGIPLLNTPAWDISRFSPDHQVSILELILSIQQKEFGMSITAQDQPDLLDIPGFYLTGKGQFWVAQVGGRVVGTIALKDIGDNQVALRKMFVAPEFRGQGVAEALLARALDWCREKGVDRIFLGTTDQFVAAHGFYEKQGFSRLEKSELPAAFPVMVVDTIFYTREVTTE